MMEKQVVGERASEYLDGKASSKAGPSMRDLPQDCRNSEHACAQILSCNA